MKESEKKVQDFLEWKKKQEALKRARKIVKELKELNDSNTIRGRNCYATNPHKYSI